MSQIERVTTSDPKKGTRGFALYWEKHQTKSVWKTKEEAPFSFKERQEIAKRMTVPEILDVNVREENRHTRLERKWREITYLFGIIRREEYNKKSIENALWLYGTTGVTVNHFVFAILNEFMFAEDLHMDAHLRWLYWSFDGGRENTADWRQIMASCKAMILYRMIHPRTAELMVHIFDIFASNSRDDAIGSSSSANATLYLTKQEIETNIIDMFCISDNDFKSIHDEFEQALAKDPHMAFIFKPYSSQRITRGMFRGLLRVILTLTKP